MKSNLFCLSTILILAGFAAVYAAAAYGSELGVDRIQMGVICSGGSCRKADSYPSVVRVAVTSEKTNSYGSGTLIVFNGRVYVLTCAHLFESKNDWGAVQFSGKTGRCAQPLAIDRSYDLAILDASIPGVIPPGAVPVSINAAAPLPGAKVYAAGYGSTGVFKVTAATVKGYVRTDGADACDTLKGAYDRSGMTVRFGDSGGGVFNEAGELVATLWGSDNDCLYGTQIGRIIAFLQTAIHESNLTPVSNESTVTPPPTLPNTAVVDGTPAPESSDLRQITDELINQINQNDEISYSQIIDWIWYAFKLATGGLPWAIVLWWSLHKKAYQSIREKIQSERNETKAPETEPVSPETLAKAPEAKTNETSTPENNHANQK